MDYWHANIKRSRKCYLVIPGLCYTFLIICLTIVMKDFENSNMVLAHYSGPGSRLVMLLGLLC